jgi:glycosyltransferase involved in cell wall biosynthesis
VTASISVVLAVYERADALDVVLRGFAEQTPPLPQIVIADDGSGPSVVAVADRWRDTFDLVHVRQENEGFRKARMQNLGAEAASGDYLLFLDGDCVPRTGFLDAVRRAARPGWFLTTKRLLLGEAFTRRILDGEARPWRWSTAEWLVRAPRELGRPGYLIPVRDRRRPWRERQPEFFPPFHAYTMLGLSRADFERVNGYEGRCTRSTDGEDQDLAIRLRRSGMRCGWPGPKATVLHLWHPVRADRSDRADRVFQQTQASDHVEAVLGLRQLRAELGRS